MNWTIVEGKWDQLKGDIKDKWAKITDDDLTSVSAKKDKLVGKIVERYGILKNDAEKQVDQWIAGIGDTKDTDETNRN